MSLKGLVRFLIGIKNGTADFKMALNILAALRGVQAVGTKAQSITLAINWQLYGVGVPPITKVELQVSSFGEFASETALLKDFDGFLVFDSIGRVSHIVAPTLEGAVIQAAKTLAPVEQISCAVIASEFRHLPVYEGARFNLRLVPGRAP